MLPQTENKETALELDMMTHSCSIATLQKLKQADCYELKRPCFKKQKQSKEARTTVPRFLDRVYY